jgi:hypothetical protein
LTAARTFALCANTQCPAGPVRWKALIQCGADMLWDSAVSSLLIVSILARRRIRGTGNSLSPKKVVRCSWSCL